MSEANHWVQREARSCRRIIAISDIHGEGLLLRRLLERLKPSAEDLVVLMGDYINRGEDSHDALHTVMQLAQQENVVVLKGNMDRLIDWYFFRGSSERVFNHFREYRAQHYGILFFEWAEQCGIHEVTMENFEAVRAELAERFQAEGDFVRALPFGLETEDHVFVHAGLTASENWRDSTEQELLKNDPFLTQGQNHTGKTVLVGHTPVWNSLLSGNSCNPIIDRTRNIIGIDGGIGVKEFSQLNALVVTRTADGYRYETVSEDRYPRFSALRDYTPDASPWPVLKDLWPDYHLEILSEGTDFSLCRLTGSGQTGLVKNECIVRDDSPRYLRSSVSARLPVSAGETLALLDDTCSGYLYVKNEAGAIGWVPRNVLA